jgi:hypothetical protein
MSDESMGSDVELASSAPVSAAISGVIQVSGTA